ncbi:proline-rich proteoglycan 2-like [Littorina saxatilis]|uniref:Uncharacterized protein n=1 Tax=Littorina saxatilis TaxID=31220 RepID=A0AAN9GKM5_9CAEN
MKEKLLDKDTIDAYHSYVQSQIRWDLNSIWLGPGKLPCRIGIGLITFGLCSLLVGILLICLRMRHVYFWDWEVQFVGPFFIILFLLCFSGATYLILLATRRSNRFRRELYFQPLGDYGIAAVHKDDLIHEQELKHDLKSGTTPHKNIKPRSEAYSQMNLHKPEKRSGQNNQAYRHGPSDPHRRPPDGRRPPHPDDRRGRGAPPSDGRRGPPRYSDDRRGPPRGPPPPGEFRKGPPPNDRQRDNRDRRGPPDDRDRRGPPDDRDRRGPPPDGYRGPPPDGYRGPPQNGQRGPPPNGNRGDDRRGPPPDRRGPPPPDDKRGPPPSDRRGSPPDDRRPRGVPRFSERSPDDSLGKVKLEDNRDSESEL